MGMKIRRDDGIKDEIKILIELGKEIRRWN